MIEVIVVITIISLLVGLVILNFREGMWRQDLSLTGNQTYAMLQQARADVASGKKLENEDEGTFNFLCEGAYFEVGQKPMMANTLYDLEKGVCLMEALESEDYGSIPNSVITDSIVVGESTVKELWVLFEPPAADIAFYSSIGERLSNDAVLELMHSRNETLRLNVSLGAENNQISVTLP